MALLFLGLSDDFPALLPLPITHDRPGFGRRRQRLRLGDVGVDARDHNRADVDVATEERQQREPDVELCNGGADALIVFRLGRQIECRVLESEPESWKEAEFGIALDNQLAPCLGLHLLLRHVEQGLLVNKHG